ncbi:galactose-3-O-sulfotransferase 2 [Chanos chanos]|uniref:Galactose-3-O-sulfotransferase 2 n=1 Tax=Chanos chanos TaxID=29144 RepID=A0A6J2WQ08_CHACN|nr:galactose-3-O-sulfotransferase 2-like [Chanos chanos]
MTLRWMSMQLWRRRVTGPLVALLITVLLMFLATHSLQNNREHDVSAVERKAQRSDGVMHPSSHHNPSNTHRQREQPRPDSDPHQHGRRKRSLPPIAFLKTHKTGSSTVQNILFRLGERERATFAFPYISYQFSYPNRFQAKYVDELPAGSSQFDILCSHMRLDLPQLKQVMPPNTVLFTILRDPTTTFESTFNYYTNVVPAFAKAKNASRVTGGKSALATFLENPDAFWNPHARANGPAKNPMSFDLGLNNVAWSLSWPSDLIQLEDAFHLVMIMEHFDESLVLLGDLLGLETEDLAYVRLNARAGHQVSPLERETREKIREWNSLDVLLYDFFFRLFWEKAKDYGLDRLNEDVAQLRVTRERLKQKCVSKEAVPPGELEDLLRPWQSETATIVGYKVREDLGTQDQAFCVRLVLPELQYHSHLYFQQYGRDMRAVPPE